MELRTLRPEEREALLALLDAWDLGDGWRGRAFFRRYLEHDPTYRDANVHVAAEDGQLLSCVQIFPRRIRLGGGEVPVGGIGTVFTSAQARRRGLAEALLARAVEDMKGRGMELSLLFAARIPWYTKLGWRSQPVRRTRLLGPGAPGPTGCAPFDAERDLAAVRQLHQAYSGARDGSAVRDDALWRASLRNAGNPGEDFLVARVAARVRAYARATRLAGQRVLLEWGREPDAVDALADLVARLAGAGAFAPDLDWDAPLAAALAARGLARSEVTDPMGMWRCLDAAALARRLGHEPGPDEAPEELLQRALPARGALYWLADRF